MGVLLRVKLVAPFTLYCPFDLFGRHGTLLDDAVGENRRDFTVKKVQYSVIDSLKADPQFVNLVPQKVGFWSTQFMAEFPQSLDFHQTFGDCLRWQRLQPVEDWHGTIVVFVKYDLGMGH